MNTSKHTPGPWVVNEEGRMVEAQVPNLRNEYEHICDLRGGIRGQINTANAHLIAAAPAMYQSGTLTVDIMERVVKELERKGLEELRSLLRSAIIEQKQALAQAEGK